MTELSQNEAPNVPAEPYNHEPLDLQKDQIRLLHLKGYQDSVIHCTLQTYNFNDCPLYDALSYTWGPETPVYSIMVNGRSFSIRENLWHFLDQTATGFTCKEKTCQPALLWIDQICINQASAREKNHQVSQMASIYKRATRVFAWLGEGNVLCDSTMRSLAGFDWTDDRKKKVAAAAEIFKYYEGNIFDRSYWRRLWIVQEFVLPDDLYVLCGSFYVEWDHIEDFTLSLVRQQFPDHAYFLFMIRRRRHRADLESNLSMEELLPFLYDFRCTDARDRIYGLLGLPKIDYGICVDYTLPPPEVFWRCIVLILKYHKHVVRVMDLYLPELGFAMGVDGTEQSLADPEVERCCRGIFMDGRAGDIEEGVRRYAENRGFQKMQGMGYQRV